MQAKDPALATANTWTQLFARPGFRELVGAAAVQERGGHGQRPHAEDYEDAFKESLERLYVMSKFDTKYKRAFYQLLGVVAQKQLHSIPLVIETFR